MTGSDAPYQPISQLAPEDGQVSTPLQVEDDEIAFVEDFVNQERVASHDPRIGWIHLVLGGAVLLPWNVLIIATPYFLARLDGSSFKSTFGSYLSTTFTVSNFIFLAHATATTRQSTTSRRAIQALGWLTVLTFALTISTYIHAPPGLFFTFVLLNGIAQAAAGSYLQTSVIAVASLFGPTVIQSVMSGQAVIAIAVSGVEVLSAYASLHNSPSPEALVASEPEEESAFIFFGLSTLFLIGATAAHIWLTRLPAYKAIVDQFSHTAETHRQSSSLTDREVESDTPLVDSKAQSAEKQQQLIRVAKSNVVYNFAVAYVFIVTLSVFPPITISIMPTNPATHPLIFSAIHFLVFSTEDWLGRYSCSFPRLVIWSSKRLLTLSLARTLFIPVFLMCNIQRASTVPNIAQAVISSDYLYMFILLAFGFSNGYVSSLCMMSAPSAEHNPRLKGRLEDVDVAATVASFCLVGGLAVGSFMSFGVRSAVCKCNPFVQ